MGFSLTNTPGSRGLRSERVVKRRRATRRSSIRSGSNSDRPRLVLPFNCLNGPSRLLESTSRRVEAALRSRCQPGKIRKALKAAPAILVAVNDPLKQENVAALIRQQFPDDQIIFTRDLPEIYASGVPALNVFIKVVVGVATAISMLVILLAMYTTVTERTRQIGILKALGMSKTGIAWVIEQEAILVSLLGVSVGIGLTFAARLGVMRMTTLVVDVEARWILVALLVGIVGGSIGALYPALRAARQDAVDALSYE